MPKSKQQSGSASTSDSPRDCKVSAGFRVSKPPTVKGECRMGWPHTLGTLWMGARDVSTMHFG